MTGLIGLGMMGQESGTIQNSNPIMEVEGLNEIAFAEDLTVDLREEVVTTDTLQVEAVDIENNTAIHTQSTDQSMPDETVEIPLAGQTTNIVTNEGQINVPAQIDETVTQTVSTCAGIDINKATIDTLVEIIHIDQMRAQELMRLRPFISVDSLTRVNGIGPARLRDIKEQGLACI